MILKDIDSIEPQLNQLNEILSMNNLSSDLKKLVEQEKRMLIAGYEGEKESAYYLNTYFADKKRTYVIHDLKLNFKGLTAQIDHIVVNNYIDVFVIEAKNFKSCIKINDFGEFILFSGKKYIGIPSPIEQNNRHILILQKILKKFRREKEVKNFFNYIVFSPKSVIIRSTVFKTPEIIKADQLPPLVIKELDNKSFIEDLLSTPNFFGRSKAFAEFLVTLHTPHSVNYYKKFGIKKAESLQSKKSNANFYCFGCKTIVDEQVASFCFNNKKIFGGRVFCLNCQRKIKS